MIRIAGVLEIRHVASCAVRRQARRRGGCHPTGGFACVALVTRQGGVRPCQWKDCLRVVKPCTRPRSCGVAVRASGGEARRHMSGTRRLVEICQMASDTVAGDGLKLAAGMALCTGNRCMGSGQRKLCQAVIELGALPTRCGVAGIALRG